MEKEKQSKVRNRFLKAITVTFQNAPFSPGRDHKFRSDNNTNRWGAKSNGGGKGFSGPMVTMIPYEARRKPKDGGVNVTQEPTSPKISCMGQIKHHKKKHIPKSKTSDASTPKDASKSKFQRIFSQRSKPKSNFVERKLDETGSIGGGNKAPPMGDMKRFASGREAFSSFNWKAVIEPEEIDGRDCFTDGEDDEILIPFSAPILVGGDNGDDDDGGGRPCLKFKPRNEINLWKRRTMAPPRPLQLNPVLKAK
ncbi:hypothetical protein RYX36_023111 [Vicia faba]